MPRPVTPFAGQWADSPLEKPALLAVEWEDTRMDRVSGAAEAAASGKKNP